MLLPEVLAVQRRGECEVALELRVAPELAYFDGHFPGMPILPGVVQVDWAVRLAQQHLPVSGQFSTLEAVKFNMPVLPDTALTLVLQWDAERTRLTFSFTADARKCSSGRIVFGGTS